MKRGTTLFILSGILTVLFAGCGMQNFAGDRSASVSGSAVQKEKTETKKIRYEAENKKYGIALPEKEIFMGELEDHIYRLCTLYPIDDGSGLYDFLKEHQVLDQDLKVALYYKEEEESYYDEPDEEGRHYYHIYVLFPEQDFCLPVCYNARGFSLNSTVENPIVCKGEEDSDEGEDTYSEIENDIKKYKKWGESVLHIKKSIVETYSPPEDENLQREQIRKDCMKQIRKYGKNGEFEEDVDIYIYDFLPGDDWLEGRIISTDLKDGDVPVSWLHIHVCYKGKKMETYNGVRWYPRSSTMFNGSGYSLKAAKEAAKEFLDEMLPEHCFMAYRIKDGKISSLK